MDWTLTKVYFKKNGMRVRETRQSKHCGFCIYIFDNSKSKSMGRLVRAEKMVLSGLVFARKIVRMILIQNMSHSQMLGKFEYTLPAKF